METVGDPDFSDSSFQLGRCSACAREVLTYPAFESDGQAHQSDDPVHQDGPEREAWCCVHCDTAVIDGLRLVSGEDLPDVGYGLLELQGCGNPDCGGGRCSREIRDEPAG